MAKAARKRLESTVLGGWSEVDEHLEQLADVRRQQTEFEQQINEQVDRLKGQLAEYTAPLVETEKRLTLEVEQFLVAHQGEFAAVRSRRLNFGEVGFRRSTAITFKPKLNAPQVIELCKTHGHLECVRVKEAVDKEAMAGLSDVELSKVGCQRKEKDTPWIEIFEVKIADTVDAQAI